MKHKENGTTKKYNIDFREYKLDNGLNVILAKNQSIPYFALNLSYHVGSKNESIGTRGFAHLFEHLMFTGSKNCPEDGYDRYCNLAGGDNSAYTTEDKTSYILVLPSHQLELGLWMESDRMLDFSVSQENLNIQRDVVLEEKNQCYDNKPYGTVVLEMSKKLFSNSYSWTPIGEEDDLRKIDLETAKEFFYSFYTPNNAVLTISGDIDYDNTMKLINKYFGEIKPGKEIKFKYNDEPLSGELKETIYDNVTLPGIFISYKAAPENSFDYYNLNVLSYIMAEGDSSFLYKDLVYDKQLAFESDCFSEGFEFSGIFSIYALLHKRKKIEELESSINENINKLLNGGVSQTDINKAINKIEFRYYQRRQTNSALADLLSHYKILHNDAGLVNYVLDKYSTITKDTLINTAQKYLIPSNRITLYYLPKK